MVVVQLAEQLLILPEVRSSNPVYIERIFY